MYRPNRIGPYTVANLMTVQTIDTKTTFASHDSAANVYGAYSLNTVSNDEFMREGAFFDNTTGPVLPTGMQVGIGVQLTGAETERTDHIYSISGSVSWLNNNANSTVSCCLGRLVAAPSTSASIAVPNAISLPLQSYVNDTSYGKYASIDTSVVITDIDGGTPPGTFFDICAFWRFTNVAGSDINLKYLEVNIGLHRYMADLITFDPAR